MSLSIACIASDVNRLDYCLEAALKSFSLVADEICISIGKCSDGTYEIIDSVENEFPSVLFKKDVSEWVFDRNIQTEKKNRALEMCSSDWVLILDADEVLHEKDISNILKATELDIDFIKFNVNHYYGLPHWINQSPGWYRTHTRMWKRSAGVRCSVGSHCIDKLIDSKGRDVHHIETGHSNATIHHYGHCRDAKVYGQKQARLEGCYRNVRDIRSGDLPEHLFFEYKIPELGYENAGNLVRYRDTHPRSILSWINKEKYIRWRGEGHLENVLSSEGVLIE